MDSQSDIGRGLVHSKATAPAAIVLLTAAEAARILKVSLSWLAKARMRGDGPPFIKVDGSKNLVDRLHF